GAGRALAEPVSSAPVNMELNYPSVPGQAELLAAGLAPLLRTDALGEALGLVPANGTGAAREAAAGLLAMSGWRPEPERFLFTGNARQAIAAALAHLVRPGGRVGVESLTYPLVKEIAGRLGVTLVPLATDGEGLRPDAVAAAHRAAPLSAVYVQPTLHNPTSTTMPHERRAELASVVRELDLPVVEDRIWAFLAGAGAEAGVGQGADPGAGEDEGGGAGEGAGQTAEASRGCVGGALPLAAYAPERVYVVDGLSKRVAPGLTVGFLVVPEGRAEEAGDALRSGGWAAGRFALEAAVRWIADGTVARLVAAKREDAAARQRLVREGLAGFAVRGDARAYYAWWELPEPWRADTFCAAVAERGVAVTPGPAFSVPAVASGVSVASASALSDAGRPVRMAGRAQVSPFNCVRLGLASVGPRELAEALVVLGDVARGGR
uniref:aminotransferase class I/II-fold pyridoxal phosphate-dependent enzyme n=1 Tax=Streptomyces torulosus TaxID=68276 RepID=UPI0006EBC4D9